MDYVIIWAALMALAVFAYVILDGFDLGIGILFPFIKSQKDKALAMNTITPFWDGNETWLVLGGGGLYATFPLAYSIIFPAIYAPLIVMLLSLIFRGVAFEFRWKAETKKGRKSWDLAFALGSLSATFSQGVALGALVQGIEVQNRSYAGGWWDWLSWFSVTTGLALVVGYSLLGACWLIYKTENRLQEFAYKYAKKAAVMMIVMIGVVSLWMTFKQSAYMNRWFDYPNWVYLSPIPLLVAALSVLLIMSLKRRNELSPFLFTVGLFVLSYFGLLISFYPNIVPESVTIWQAAAPESSLKFLLIGSSILIPTIIAYTSYSYWIFRGKVKQDESYH